MLEMILTEDSIELFLKLLSEKGRSSATTRAYGTDLKCLLNYVRSSSSEFSTFENAAESFLTKDREKSSPRTIARRMTAFRRFAKVMGGAVILEDYTPPRAEKARPHPIPSGMAGIADMATQCSDDWEKALVALLGRCGLRISEARSVLPSSISMTSQSIRVVGKGDRVRYVPVSMAAWEEIMPRYEQCSHDNSPLIPLSDSGARRAWKRIAGRAGLGDSSSHDGRATIATAMMHKTKNIRTVQDFLGHATSATTEMYTEVTMDHMRAGVEV